MQDFFLLLFLCINTKNSQSQDSLPVGAKKGTIGVHRVIWIFAWTSSCIWTCDIENSQAAENWKVGEYKDTMLSGERGSSY